ncbi:sugar-binding transcriptional regulator [Olsenella urininfantis]|uniref:sugar-binding transcriptional regulator n=1 Tax=Olsenella urininfantis TaxID=1871033 RepID=UPI0009853EDF|nr:sugar-binding domain-containing protein [Olsenella urininfantis]
MSESEYSLTLKAAWYYYMESYTQQEISSLMGISRAKVIRLLDEARQGGIIRFSFREEDQVRMDVERRLIEGFGLDDAMVVPTPVDESSLLDSIARAASMYVTYHLKPNGYLNIGYGDTMGLTLSHLANSGRKDFSVVSLTGGVSYYLPKVPLGSLNMKLYLTPTPLTLSSVELKEALMREPSIQSISRMTALADMSVMSLGSLTEDATTMRNGIIDANDLALLRMEGCVGDILNHFIDSRGEVIPTSIDDRSVSTSLESLCSMKNVVGVAGGAAKVAVLRAALAHDYLNVLITDEQTALGLLGD